MPTDTEVLKNKLAKVLETIKNHPTFPEERKCRFFANYTEEYRTFRTKYEISRQRIPDSKFFPLSEDSCMNEGSTQLQATSEEQPHQVLCEYHSFKHNVPLLQDIVGPQIPILGLAQERE